MNRNFYATILIVLAIGLYFTVTKGIIADTTVIRASNQEYITALNNAKKLIDLRDENLRKYNSISVEDRDRLEKILPKSVDNIKLIIDLNSVALKHGFSLKDVKVLSSSNKNSKTASQQNQAPEANSGPALDTVVVSFSLGAPYQQFVSFLQDLEASLRIFDISSLSVSANDTGVYDWKVEINTYWLKEPKTQ